MNNLRQGKKTVADEKTLRYYLIVWDRIAKKWKEGVDQFLHNAPALIIIHLREHLTSSPGVDSALAAMPMVLMAETLGLGTCINGNVNVAVDNSEELRKFLKIPADHRVHVAFTVGYPDIKYLRMVARNPAKIEWIRDSGKI
jgi:nitroreductase